MQVKLNAFRGADRPGDIVDVPDGDGATLIAHGAAFPADDIDAELAKETAAARTVQAGASLQAASGADTDQTPAP
jgi:hypothetical protein